MKKKFLNILFLLSSLLTASIVDARSFESKTRFHFSPKPSKIHCDERMIAAAEIAVSSARKNSRKRCWRAVKNAMLQARAVLSRPTTKYAKQAGDELEQKFGFKKLAIHDPFDAPVGSVLVYGGRGAGHVEIRTVNGFVSDFNAPRPSNRPLLGVYVRA